MRTERQGSGVVEWESFGQSLTEAGTMVERISKKLGVICTQCISHIARFPYVMQEHDAKPFAVRLARTWHIT
jgi:hypothetical protein